MRACLKQLGGEAWKTAGWGRGQQDALIVARAGVFSGAAAVTQALRRDGWELSGWRGSSLVTDTAGVLLDRNPRWLPDLVGRMAAADELWTLTETLRSALGLPLPDEDPYLRGLVRSLSTTPRGQQPPSLLEVIRSDEAIRSVVPRLLRVDEVGVELAAYSEDREWEAGTGRSVKRERPPECTWEGALALAAAEGLLDRAAILDLALGALLRGGRREQVGWFLRLHDALAPDLDEVAPRARTYLRLLVDGPGRAATTAQRELRGLDEASRLEPESLLEAAAAVLTRPEKGLVTAQLTWLEKLSRRRPDHLPDIALTVGQALSHDNRDVQERALRLLGRLKAKAPLAPGVLAALQEQATSVSPVLHGLVTEVLGTVDGEPRVDEHDGVHSAYVAPPTPAAVGPPIREVHALAEAASAYLESGDELLAERVLDGLARLMAVEADGLAGALRPLVPRLLPEWAERDRSSYLSGAPLNGLLLAASEPTVPRPPTSRSWFGLRRRAARAIMWADPNGPQGLFSARVREALRLARDTPAPDGLLAAPSMVTGHVDPDRVVAAVAAAAAAATATLGLGPRAGVAAFPARHGRRRVGAVREAPRRDRRSPGPVAARASARRSRPGSGRRGRSCARHRRSCGSVPERLRRPPEP